MRRTTAYERLLKQEGALRILQGGMSAGKTFSLMQYFVALAEQRHDKILTVVSDVLPSLKHGAMVDLKTILRETRHEQCFEHNKSENIWTNVHTGSVIEFYGMENELKARGARRDYLFVNEVNRISKEVFEQLYGRTRCVTWVDFNPSERFWLHEYAAEHDTPIEVFTFRDNEELGQKELDFILSHDRESNWWKVYGEGQIGELEGNVYKGWAQAYELPESCELLGYGLDLGFSPDPCALVSLWRTDGDGLIAKQEINQTGLIPDALVSLLHETVEPDVPIVVDNARPELISMMQDSGLLAFACIKEERINGERVGRLAQIGQMKAQKFTAIGKDLWNEYLSYQHIPDKKTGKYSAAIAKGNDHFMDALRYFWYWWKKDATMLASVDAAIKEY